MASSAGHTTRYVFVILSLVGIGGSFRSTLTGLHIKVLYISFLLRSRVQLTIAPSFYARSWCPQSGLEVYDIQKLSAVMARETGPYHQVRMCVSLVQWQLADWFPIRLTLTGVHSSVLHSFFWSGVRFGLLPYVYTFSCVVCEFFCHEGIWGRMESV